MKKGTPVYLFRSWDHKGTVAITRYTVGSWGKRQAHLTNGADKNYKHRLYVESINNRAQANGVSFVVAQADCPDPEAYALELAALVLEQQQAHFARCLTTCDDKGYQSAINQDIAALHAPRTIWTER